MKHYKLLLLMLVVVLISGCYSPIPYEERTEYGKCIIDCESPFNCRLTTFNLKIECDGNKEPKEIQEFCENECKPK